MDHVNENIFLDKHRSANIKRRAARAAKRKCMIEKDETAGTRSYRRQ